MGLFDWLSGKRKQATSGHAGSPNLKKIYPYVVPAGYVERTPGIHEGLIRPLGHNLFVMLVHDLDGICRNVFPAELAAINLSAPAAHERAMHNLEILAEGQFIEKSLFEGPAGIPFVLWAGHWLTASCIRLPEFYHYATTALKADTLCVSIPQREAMLLFPLGTQNERNYMRAMIHENEQDARKLVTWELFTLCADGLQEFRAE